MLIIDFHTAAAIAAMVTSRTECRAVLEMAGIDAEEFDAAIDHWLAEMTMAAERGDRTFNNDFAEILSFEQACRRQEELCNAPMPQSPATGEPAIDEEETTPIEVPWDATRYATLVVDLELYPHFRARVTRKYGVVSERRLGEIHAEWRTRTSREPKLLVKMARHAAEHLTRSRAG